MLADSESNVSIGPLHVPLTWYKLGHAGTQVAQCDFQNKATRTSPLSQCYAAQHSYVPLLSLRRDSPSKIVPAFSVRPCVSVGRVTADLFRKSWVRFPPSSKDFFFASCGSLFPFTRANAQWVIHGFSSTLSYPSELILCSTISLSHAFDLEVPLCNLRPSMLLCTM